MVYMGSKAKITDYIVPVIQGHIAVSGSSTRKKRTVRNGTL